MASATDYATTQPPLDLLFVYGTLRPDSDHPIGRLLADYAERIGPAVVRGAMYDLGAYPAAVPEGAGDAALAAARGGSREIRGELLRLRDPSLLRTLDLYEGFEFVREQRTVELWDGSPVEAWVYVYHGPLDGAPRVASGSWASE